MTSDLLENSRVKQRLHPKKKFLYIAMMSADKFISSRVKAAVQTWASSIRTWNVESNVDVEIFAQSNETIGFPIVKMPGVSDNVYPPQKVIPVSLQLLTSGLEIIFNDEIC